MSFKVEGLDDYNENVSTKETDEVQEKVFYVYNNFRNLKDGKKLDKVREYMKNLIKDYEWSVVVLTGRPNSMTYDKLFMFRVSCKYIIGIMGVECE